MVDIKAQFIFGIMVGVYILFMAYLATNVKHEPENTMKEISYAKDKHL